MSSMNYIIGVDIGNATTESTLACLSDTGALSYLCSHVCKTTGTKGTPENIVGIRHAIDALLKHDPNIIVSTILINDAAPVIADYAMDTITETVITDSTMIGHDPNTPGGTGMGVGYTFHIEAPPYTQKNLIAVIPESIDFNNAARRINQYTDTGHHILGAIVQKDEGTLINNRLKREIPIVDEVRQIEKVPLDMLCAVEVASPGYSIEQLSNPFGIATVFHLNSKEMEYCKHIAKSIIGNRSAVIIKTPEGQIEEKVIPAGSVEIKGKQLSRQVTVDSGAEKIMNTLKHVGDIVDVAGEPGTNIGGMIEGIKVNMANSSNLPKEEIRITDLFAADTQTAMPIQGGLAGEYAMESGVAVAAMIHADGTFMNKVAVDLQSTLDADVKVGGIEAEMALTGALTTPGTELPLLMIDIGAGSTDAALMEEDGKVKSIHLAGAGNLVTMIINSELNLNNFDLAEEIKKYPLAKVESLYRIRYEDGQIGFREEPLSPEFYGRTVVVRKDGSFSIVDVKQSVEAIRTVRREAKKKVLVTNVLRALDRLDVRHTDCKQVILVGGSFLDFESANLITEALSKEKITAGKGNIRGTQGPRNAVATGLIIGYAEAMQ